MPPFSHLLNEDHDFSGLPKTKVEGSPLKEAGSLPTRSTSEVNPHLKNNLSDPQLTIFPALSSLLPPRLHTFQDMGPSESTAHAQEKGIFKFCFVLGWERNEREKRMSSRSYGLGTFFLSIEDLFHRSCAKRGK